MPHTPGPWAFGPTGSTMRGYSQPFAIAEHGKANLVAGCFGDVAGGEDTAHANARLIAAAPDLLEALTLLLECRDAATGRIPTCRASWESAEREARAAIAKATSEG